MSARCKCGEPLTDHDCEHPGRCCDCFDLLCGWQPMPKVDLSDEVRAATDAMLRLAKMRRST